MDEGGCDYDGCDGDCIEEFRKQAKAEVFEDIDKSFYTKINKPDNNNKVDIGIVIKEIQKWKEKHTGGKE